MQFLMSLWCWKPNQAIKRSKITQVFGFGIEIRREGKRLITLKSEVWNWVKRAKITYRTRITSKNLQSQKEVIWKLGLAPLRNQTVLLIQPAMEGPHDAFPGSSDYPTWTWDLFYAFRSAAPVFLKALASLKTICKINQLSNVFSIAEYCRVLESITDCYWVFQSVVECYTVLQIITECYRM